MCIRDRNTVTRFSVYAMDEDGKEIPLSKTEYRDYIAAFAPSPSERPIIWSWSPGSKDEFGCTFFNYLAVGAPSCVKFYKTWEDQVEDRAAFTLSFTYAAPAVKLIIAKEELSADDLVGTYEATVSADGDSETHVFYLERYGNGLVITDEMDSLALDYDPCLLYTSEKEERGQCTLHRACRRAGDASCGCGPVRMARICTGQGLGRKIL